MREDTYLCYKGPQGSPLLYLMLIMFDLQAYHSALTAPTSMCRMAILPVNTKYKGPAPPGGTTQTAIAV